MHTPQHTVPLHFTAQQQCLARKEHPAVDVGLATSCAVRSMLLRRDSVPAVLDLPMAISIQPENRTMDLEFTETES